MIIIILYQVIFNKHRMIFIYLLLLILVLQLFVGHSHRFLELLCVLCFRASSDLRRGQGGKRMC